MRYVKLTSWMREISINCNVKNSRLSSFKHYHVNEIISQREVQLTLYT